MLTFLITLHGEMRWIVLLIAVAAVVKFAIGWLAKQDYKALDARLMTGFSVVLSLNFVLGLILLIWLSVLTGVQGARFEHALVMLLAVLTSTQSTRWKRSEDDALKFRNNLLLILGALLLVLVGVWRIQGGWIV